MVRTCVKPADLAEIPPAVKRVFVTAAEIAPSWHVRMQAAFQRNVDSGVSKTVNLPNTTTRQDVADIYMQAFDEGLKGIPIYRDGSRNRQPLSGSRNSALLRENLEQEY